MIKIIKKEKTLPELNPGELFYPSNKLYYSSGFSRLFYWENEYYIIRRGNYITKTSEPKFELIKTNEYFWDILISCKYIHAASRRIQDLSFLDLEPLKIKQIKDMRL